MLAAKETLGLHDIIFVYCMWNASPSVDYLVGCLDNFEKFIHENDRLSPLVKAALIHSQFEMIHPFLDGNGRVGRLLIAFYLAAKDILHKPTLYISKFIKRNQQAYYDCLYNIHAKGDYETWIKFFLTMAEKTIVFNEVKPAFQYFALKGIKCAIVSTKFRYRIKDILDRDELTHFVEVIIGGEDVKRPKPDPEGLQKAITTLAKLISFALGILI